MLHWLQNLICVKKSQTGPGGDAMAITTRETAGAREWIARPEPSPLTPAVRRGLICLILAASILISLGFWLAGAWLVLLLAGLELFFFVALRALARRDASFESIRLEGDLLDRHPPSAGLRIAPQLSCRLGPGQPRRRAP